MMTSATTPISAASPSSTAHLRRPLLASGYDPSSKVRPVDIQLANSVQANELPDAAFPGIQGSPLSDEVERLPAVGIGGRQGSMSTLFGSGGGGGGGGGGEPPASQILPFLFLGGIGDAHDIEFLKRNNVTTIVNVSTEKYWGVYPLAVVHSFPMPDSSNFPIETHFEKVLGIINWVRKQWVGKRSQRMLIHCQKGRSRSATMVIAYLIRENGWSVAEAMDFVRARRPVIEPNLGFMEALRKLQESLEIQDRSNRRKRCVVTLRNVRRGLDVDVVRQVLEGRGGFVSGVTVFRKQARAGGSADSEDAGGSAVLSPGADQAPLTDEGTTSSTWNATVSERPALFMVHFACFEQARDFQRALHKSSDVDLADPAGEPLVAAILGGRTAVGVPGGRNGSRRRGHDDAEGAKDAARPADEEGLRSASSQSDTDAPAAESDEGAASD